MQDAQSPWPKGTVFTVGHSTLPIEQFIALLKTYGVDYLLDIRTVPKSRHNPQFNSDDLKQSLAGADIAYRAVPELGGLRHARKDSPNGGWRNKSFRGYADYMQTAGFQSGLQLLIDLSRKHRVAIMCAEAVPWRCHRRLLADALLARGVVVEHIVGKGRTAPHELTPFAVREGRRVLYPAADDA